LADTEQITWDPEADRRIKRSPFLMRRFIRKRIEDASPAVDAPT
jgi:hypothetical protein